MAINDRKLLGSKTAEDMGAMAGLRHADVVNGRVAAGASIMYDVWQAAREDAKQGTRKFVKLADKIAYEHCYLATFQFYSTSRGVLLVQWFADDQGFEVYVPITNSARIDDTLNAIRALGVIQQ